MRKSTGEIEAIAAGEWFDKFNLPPVLCAIFRSQANDDNFHQGRYWLKFEDLTVSISRWGHLPKLNIELNSEFFRDDERVFGVNKEKFEFVFEFYDEDYLTALKLICFVDADDSSRVAGLCRLYNISAHQRMEWKKEAERLFNAV